MVFATPVMRTLAGGAVAPFVSEKLRRIAADGWEMYLYPADLLLRGRPTQVARVRAMFDRTKLDANAYLVGSPEAQKIQMELSHLNETLDVGRDVQLATRLRNV